MSGKEWTSVDNDYLRRAYPDQPSIDIAKKLGRSKSSVYGQATKLGLKKSAAYLAAKCRLQPGSTIGAAFRFDRGHVPANKGLRRPGYSKGRMQETQFKKGGRPRNTLPVGTIKADADGYLRIKVGDAPEPLGRKGARSPNWQYIHKRVWEAAHGPIPPGHRIWWKDRDHANCALDNLGLLTDQQHIARTTIHNLPPELKQVIQLKGALKRVIRRKAGERAEESTGRSKEPSVRNA